MDDRWLEPLTAKGPVVSCKYTHIYVVNSRYFRPRKVSSLYIAQRPFCNKENGVAFHKPRMFVCRVLVSACSVRYGTFSRRLKDATEERISSREPKGQNAEIALIYSRELFLRSLSRFTTDLKQNFSSGCIRVYGNLYKFCVTRLTVVKYVRTPVYFGRENEQGIEVRIPGDCFRPFPRIRKSLDFSSPQHRQNVLFCFFFLRLKPQRGENRYLIFF